MIKEAVLKEKLIAIVRSVPSAQLLPMAEAMYAGGVRLLEVTYSACGAVSDEQTANDIARLAAAFEGRMHIGAGTVLTEQQVILTQQAGGKFIISPDVNEAVIRCTNANGLVSIPGALTPSEITAARRAGADFVKLFPISALGPAYVKAITAPLSHIPLLAVGGVDLSNMETYRNAGVAGFGIGSNVIDKKALAAGDFEKITALAAAYVKAAKV